MQRAIRGLGLIFGGSLLAGGGSLADAQEPPVFRAEVGLVQVEVRVTDDGEPVLGLGRDDFVLKENGREQEIVAFDAVGLHRSGPEPSPASQPAPGAEETSPTAASRNPNQYTWLYIVPEVQGPLELSRVARSIREFLEERLPDGFMVSLAGLPFTDDRALLLTSLRKMVDQPFGAVDPVLDVEADLTFEREVAAALQRQNGIRTSFVGMSYDPPSGGGRQDDVASLVSVERIDRQIIFFGRLALLRYLDLIERMATFPGKKMILLYRSGLRVDPAHSELMKEIGAAAVRHRVSFFVTDSRGLLTSEPAEDRGVPRAWDSSRRRRVPDLIGRQLAEVDPQQGLVSLASTTGGRAVVNSGDMGAILEDVLDESSNYYLLGFRPDDPRQAGRFRKVEVSVKRRGVDVRTPKGYFERKAFEEQSKKERSIALYQALSSGTSTDLVLQASVSFFAAPDGRTATIFSTGVRPHELARQGKANELEATILIRVRNRVFDSMPVFFEQSVRSELGEQAPPSGEDPAAMQVAYNARADLAPGHYSLRVLFRDDLSGRMGTLDRSFRVPDLRAASVPSSLLLTRLARPLAPAPAEAESQPPPQDDLLRVGELRLAPEPGRTYRRGDLLHWTYHLYNPTSADLAAAGQGLQMGLLRDGEWLPPGEVEAGGEAYPEEERRVIRFGAWIDTRGLRPGRYTVLAILPNYRERQDPELTADFELLP